ncbi:MAG TPA: DNA-processing protein DprA [Candidatus Krumholzibacteria bacterium]
MKTRCFPEQELREAIAFALLPRVGGVAFREGVERHGSASAAFRVTDAAGKSEALTHAADVIARARTKSITLLVQGEPAYPHVLLDLADPPPFLYALGDGALLRGRRVGIVGTRHASHSGERIAQQMATALVHAGAVVVSGMAFGIDAAAHRGALDAGGGTIAVLGGGVDLPYPPSHAMLHERIAASGLVLAEAPIGSRPVKGAFPKRNRIIAALSEVLVVIEAGERSGALITSRIALDLGRTVAAVPGPIDSPRNIGSNRLLSDGAAFIGRVEDVLSLAELESTAPKAVTPAVPAKGDDDPSEIAILRAVRSGTSELEDLARSSGLPPREFAGALSSLELTGRLLVTDAGSVALTSRAIGV